MALPTFTDGQLARLKLYPIDLGHTEPRSQRGNPRIANGVIGRKIIRRIAQQSAALGTTIDYEGGVGVWKPGRQPTTASGAQGR